KVLPSGENATVCTQLLCPWNLTKCLVSTSQIVTSPGVLQFFQFPPPVASSLPSGENATLSTISRQPAKVSRFSRVSRFHRTRNLSWPTVANVLLSGENASRRVTACPC